MAKFNLSVLKKDFVKAGKKLLTSTIETVKEYGTISVLDPMFNGKRAGDNGDYIMLRDATTSELMCIGVANGCPKGANSFMIKQLSTTEDIVDKTSGKVIVEANALWFKAFGVIDEVEE